MAYKEYEDGRIRCLICRETFRGPGGYEEHQRKLHNKGLTLWKVCNYCGCYFPRAYGARTHMMEMHSVLFESLPEPVVEEEPYPDAGPLLMCSAYGCDYTARDEHLVAEHKWHRLAMRRPVPPEEAAALPSGTYAQAVPPIPARPEETERISGQILGQPPVSPSQEPLSVAYPPGDKYTTYEELLAASQSVDAPLVQPVEGAVGGEDPLDLSMKALSLTECAKEPDTDTESTRDFTCQTDIQTQDDRPVMLVELETACQAFRIVLEEASTVRRVPAFKVDANTIMLPLNDLPVGAIYRLTRDDQPGRVLAFKLDTLPKVPDYSKFDKE